MIFQGKARYPVTEVILHTSATPGSWQEGKTADQMRDEFRRWHRAKGWRDIGYHRVFAPDGSMARGRSLWQIGAHVMGHNRGTIGLCMVPVKTIEKMGAFEDFYTPAQREAVKAYIQEIVAIAGPVKVTGHNDYTDMKLCPGFKVKSEDWT